MRSVLSRALFLSALTLPAFAPGCAAKSGSSTSSDAVTEIPQTPVKDQSIGNCWTYASVGWMESLIKVASSQDHNFSESYVNYWYWFEQIANDGAGQITEGGSWGKAVGLTSRYGIYDEGDFIAAEEDVIRSGRQATALAAIRASLATGALKTPQSRQDRKLVRSELDKAWGLDPLVIAQLDKLFGADASATLDQVTTLPDGAKVHRAGDFAVKLKDPATGALQDATLADAMGKGRFAGFDDARTGPLAWASASYPAASDARARRDFTKRIQRAMHDNQPVLLSWYVDFNAMTQDGKFLKPPATPGSQGGHMVIFEDYEIDNVPGFGTLPAGTKEIRPEALAAALADEAQIHFFRIKNSWGNYRSPVLAGYDDLYMEYMNGPIKICDTDANEQPIMDSCHDGVPFEDVVLPAGY
jgi:hypothetical protein